VLAIVKREEVLVIVEEEEGGPLTLAEAGVSVVALQFSNIAISIEV
tara:strand:- start:322 stop:459 length:138 start_codon:yes stop_codon:yes gene_type:complete